MNKHLILPIHKDNFPRKPRRGGPPKERKNRGKFVYTQMKNIDAIKEDFESEKKVVAKFLSPNLLFKICLNQNVSEEDFTNFLRTKGITVISPSPAGKGYWISLAEDEELKKLRVTLKLYDKKERYKLFHVIESFEPIPVGEKIGEGLLENPLDEDEAYLDIEVWRMENERLATFLKEFEKFLQTEAGEITDKFINDDSCLLRTKIKRDSLKKIFALKEISRVDRPPRPYIDYQMLRTPIDNFETDGNPDENATAIAVLDSGVLSNHPLLSNAVGDEHAAPTEEIDSSRPHDDVGHGTKVAGVALYGDIKKCIENKIFSPEVWILSAKIMFRKLNPITGEVEAAYDERTLLEHQLEDALRYFNEKFPNFKVVNISFGDESKKMFLYKRQTTLASLIDDLARRWKLVFIISTGNIKIRREDVEENYPNYLLSDEEDVKIIDPASSAYALTVGSVAQEFGPSNSWSGTISGSPAREHFPSPFTRVGLGYQGMLKPELVEEGGNKIFSTTGIEDIGGKLIVLNPAFIEDGKLFTIDYGSSFSAPKISHYIARLFNKYPDYSPNLIKALLLASAEVPKSRPSPLDEITFQDSDENLKNILKIYGYGMPNFALALSSFSNKVLLLAENTIQLDQIHLYYIDLPKEFVDTKGPREISVTLVYDPPTRKNRLDYVGVAMEFHLFKNSTIKEIIEGYGPILNENTNDDREEEIVPEELKRKEIKLKPGCRLRKRGLHQKGIKVFLRPNIDYEKPLILAIISQSRWFREDDYKQNYSVVVNVKHEAEIDIYAKIQQRIEQRLAERVRGRIR